MEWKGHNLNQLLTLAAREFVQLNFIFPQVLAGGCKKGVTSGFVLNYLSSNYLG